MLGLAAGPPPPDFDQAAFQADLAGLLASFRHLSLKDIRLGPLLQQLTEISVKHRIKLPSSLALIGKAFGQMQLAAAELDPTLDPFAEAGSFYMRQLAGQMRRWRTRSSCSTKPRRSACGPAGSSKESNGPSGPEAARESRWSCAASRS